MLTLAQAAALLGLSPSTLRGQVGKGKLRARLIGKTWTVSEREVERYREHHLGKRHLRCQGESCEGEDGALHRSAASRSPIHSATSETTPLPQQR